ncbi:N-acetylmuramoyl-L-alanine amidase [Parashewanella spongiae]|nr:N-acetylmuramoyl-L-alanine amidase [Parashewanella spongiae]MCL1077396.1 N-acetylmuramoyl-L-alanine amidase [Parashewanella spongiae]
MTRLLSIALLFLLPLQVIAANTLKGIRVWAAPESTRIVLDLGTKVKYKHFTLSKPNRLVVDLENTKLKVDLKKIKNSSKLLKRIRLSKSPKKSTARIVLDLNQAVKSKLFSLPPTAPYGHRLVVDIEPLAKSKSHIVKQPTRKLRNIIVAIDAGHGGDDPGSIGPAGTFEKKVVFEIANRLKKLIDATPGMTAYMTRKGDYFVNINRRSELARKKKVDLLISIHADAFTSPQPRGASVWVLSKGRAKSEMGRWLEQKERHSELLGGAGGIIQGNDSEQYLAMTLIDMVSDKSMALSHTIASQLVSEVGKVTKLHKKHPESGNFGVLKSPDIPSILVETGFISNPREEKLLRSSSHQKKLAKALHKGVLKYFKQHAPSDTLLANQKNMKHKVVRGDSLSKIAKRYQVSVSSIKKVNNLKSNVVRLGQTLKIPTR